MVTGENEIALSHTIGIFNNAGEGAPAVLMLHGFASNRDEVGGLYKRLSDELFKAGISSFRIDFRGWGDSSYPMEESTVGNMIKDAEEALGWMKKHRGIGEIAVQGFSLGSGVAIEVAARNSGDIKVMGLWSCINMFEEQLEELFEIDSAAVQEAMINGKAEFDLGWRKVTLGKGFFESLLDYNLQADYTKFNGKVLIIDGEEDSLITSLETYSKVAPDRTTTYAVPGADHIYKVFPTIRDPQMTLLIEQ